MSARMGAIGTPRACSQTTIAARQRDILERLRNASRGPDGYCPDCYGTGATTLPRSREHGSARIPGTARGRTPPRPVPGEPIPRTRP